MFSYAASFRTNAFHVVYRDKDGNLGTTIAGSNDKRVADQDASMRTGRANQFGLDCAYVVKPRQNGHVVYSPNPVPRRA